MSNSKIVRRVEDMIDQVRHNSADLDDLLAFAEASVEAMEGIPFSKIGEFREMADQILLFGEIYEQVGDQKEVDQLLDELGNWFSYLKKEFA